MELSSQAARFVNKKLVVAAVEKRPPHVTVFSDSGDSVVTDIRPSLALVYCSYLRLNCWEMTQRREGEREREGGCWVGRLKRPAMVSD